MQHKGITISDMLRAIYYEAILLLGLSNLYRYEHFVKKSDFWYNYEKIKVALNVQGKEQRKQTLNYLFVFRFLNENFANLCQNSQDKIPDNWKDFINFKPIKSMIPKSTKKKISW